MTAFGLDTHRLAELIPSSSAKQELFISLYLAPDPGSPATTRVRLEDLAKECADTVRREEDIDAATRARALVALASAVSAMRDAIEEHPRGTAIVFAGEHALETFHVPCALKTRAVVGWHPYVAPLAGLLEQADRYGILVADHRETKIYSYLLGELEELRSFSDPSAQNVAWAGWLGRDQLKANHHREVVLHRHLQHAADALFALHKTVPFDRLVLAGHPPATLSKLEKSLHPYLSARVAARESWEHGASADDLRAHMAGIVERVETQKEQSLVSRVRDHLSGDLQAATGADATLSALWAGRVATLLAPEGVKLAGLACEKCEFLAAESGEARRDAARCRECGGPTRRVADLVEAASELAVLTGSKVRLIGRAKAELESLGGLAALLRF